MTVSTTNVHRDVGEVWDAISGTTTTIVKDLITRAEDFTKLITGTTVGFNVPIRDLADAYTVDNVIGGLDGVSKTIGPITVGRKDLVNKRDAHLASFERAIKIKGFSTDGIDLRFDMAFD